MIKFFNYHFIRRLWFLPAVLIWAYFVLQPGPKGLQVIAFTSAMEKSVLIPAFILTIFMFSSKTEIEFCKCYGFGITKLCIAQVLPYFLFTVIAMGAGVLYFPLHTIGVTPLGRFYIFASGVINLFAATSVVVFVRLLIRNMFGSLGFELVFYYLLLFRSFEPAKEWTYHTVMGALSSMYQYKLPTDMFYANRIVFLAVGILFVAASFLLMKNPNYTEVE